MIIPRLKGGLGNQMFGIAAAYAAAKRINTNYAINYNLKHYSGQGHEPSIYKSTFFKNIPETNSFFSKIYNEPGFEYTPIPEVNDVIIDGYFQSEKHFKKYSHEIKQLFFFTNEIKLKVDSALNKIKTKKLVIHIRLGDYLLPSYKSTHFVCSRDYYNNALKQFNLNEYTILICTDSPDIYQKYFNIENAIVCNGKNELEDLYLISQCDAVVLTNSSFSWWGSYLGKTKEKICAPIKWFGIDGPKNYSDLYLDNWTIINI
jgi:hypothetical protein